MGEPVYTISMADAEAGRIRPFKNIQWAPQPDITAHELATLMPLLISIALRPLNYWEDYIPSVALRHFRIEDQK